MENYIRTRKNPVTSTLKPGYRNGVILKSGHSFGLDSNVQDNDNAPESKKKEETRRSHRTFLLRWNPAISSFKLEYYRNALLKYGTSFCMDWSVWDYENAREGDEFYMLREGDGVNPGLLFRGYFVSDPYTGDDWRGSGRRVYYVDIDCFDCVDPDGPPMIPTETLDKLYPEINWHIGHSGEVLPDNVADALGQLWDETASARWPEEDD